MVPAPPSSAPISWVSPLSCVCNQSMVERGVMFSNTASSSVLWTPRHKTMNNKNTCRLSLRASRYVCVSCGLPRLPLPTRLAASRIFPFPPSFFRFVDFNWFRWMLLRQFVLSVSLSLSLSFLPFRFSLLSRTYFPWHASKEWLLWTHTY